MGISICPAYPAGMVMFSKAAGSSSTIKNNGLFDRKYVFET